VAKPLLPCTLIVLAKTIHPMPILDVIPLPSIRPMGESDYIYLGTDGGLSFSNNGGKSFVNLNGESLPITQFYGMGVSPFTGSISAGSQDNSIMSYLPKEKKWIVAIRGDGYDVEYDKLRPNIAYGQYNSRAMMMTKNDVAPFQYGFIHRTKGKSQ
jgi:hypothetical protein